MTILTYIIVFLIEDIIEVMDNLSSAGSLEAMVQHPDFDRFLIYLAIFLVWFSAATISFILYRIIRPLAVFIMGLHAGYPYAWVAFLPYGTHFVEFALPLKEFNILNWIKTDKRETIAWTYIALDFFKPIIVTIISFIPIIGRLGEIAFEGAMAMFKWRKYYDLLKTFGFKQSAMTLSILSVFCKPLYCVLLFIMCDRTPDYGWKGFENPILIDTYSEYSE